MNSKKAMRLLEAIAIEQKTVSVSRIKNPIKILSRYVDRIRKDNRLLRRRIHRLRVEKRELKQRIEELEK